jgi:hypothetical protein
MRRLLILLPMLVLAGSSAFADSLNVNWREARIVKLSQPATSVIVGDPTVADVTLDDPTTLVVFGKAPGETNLIVLSKSQEMLLDWPVLVNPINERHVTVLDASADKAPSEVLYACGAERCTRVLSPSDIQFSASTSSNSTNSSDANKSSTASSEPVGTAPASQQAPATGGQAAPAAQ